jgi:hypothetical protein
MDPHEDLVRQNRAAIDAHQAEIFRLSNPDTVVVEVFPEDQAVLDAKHGVEEAQANLTRAQQAAYTANIRRADEALARAAADAEAETARERETDKQVFPADDSQRYGGDMQPAQQPRPIPYRPRPTI